MRKQIRFKITLIERDTYPSTDPYTHLASEKNKGFLFRKRKKEEEQGSITKKGQTYFSAMRK